MKAENKILEKEKQRKKGTVCEQALLFPTLEAISEMGTSFRRNNFTWDRLGGQAIVMIGRRYSRQPLTNHK